MEPIKISAPHPFHPHHTPERKIKSTRKEHPIHRIWIAFLTLLTMCLLGPSLPFAHAAPAYAQPGDVFITNHTKVLRVESDGSLTTVYSGGVNIHHIAFGPDGLLWIVDSGAGDILRMELDGSVTGLYHLSNTPTGLVWDDAGNLYVGLWGNATVARITPEGAISTFATGTPRPRGMSFGPNGKLYIASNTIPGRLYETSGGSATLVATRNGQFQYVVQGFDDRMYVTEWHNGVIFAYDTTTGTTSQVYTGVQFAAGIDVDADGNFYVAVAKPSTNQYHIVRIQPDGTQSLVTDQAPLFNKDVEDIAIAPSTVTRNAIATHRGRGEENVGVAVVTEGDTTDWQFGALANGNRFVPAHSIRTRPRNGGVYRLAFKAIQTGEIVPMDDPRVTTERASTHPDGTARTLILKLDMEGDNILELQVILQVKNLLDGLEPVHLDPGP